MGRWRPPTPGSSPYITAAGYRALEAELHRLGARRAETVRHLAAAAAEGDRSENAEYIYGKKQLREIDRRVRFLRQRLEGLVVVTRPPDNRSRVFFGAWVRIEDEEGHQTELRIVGPDEIDPARRYVSMDAPLARALMRRQSGDEFTVEVPGGTRSYVVTEVRYETEE